MSLRIGAFKSKILEINKRSSCSCLVGFFKFWTGRWEDLSQNTCLNNMFLSKSKCLRFRTYIRTSKLPVNSCKTWLQILACKVGCPSRGVLRSSRQTGRFIQLPEKSHSNGMICTFSTKLQMEEELPFERFSLVRRHWTSETCCSAATHPILLIGNI